MRSASAANLSLLAAMMFGLSAPSASAMGFEILKPHRAVYDLRLKEASERSGIAAMNGRIVYEITGNACEGLSVRYRFVTHITTSETSYQTDQQTSTFESPDGREFTFLTKTFVDQRPEKTVKGTAISTGEGVRVELSEPSEREVELRPAVFISTHLIDLVTAAEQGQRFVKRDVFDGSEDADEVVSSSAVIGDSRDRPEVREGEAADAVAAIGEEKAWPVNVSYFEDAASSASSETLPVYEVSFLLYRNGVSRHLVMRYPDYSLAGELTSLEMLKETPCEK